MDEYERFSDELRGILVDRTCEETLDRVMGGSQGKGFEACGRLVPWYKHTTPMNTQMRISASMRPEAAKKDT